MKVVEKKLENGHVLLEAVAATAEVSQAFKIAQMSFAQQQGVRPQKGMTIEQAVEQQLGIKDMDPIVAQQAIEYLVPFAIDKRNITPAYPPKPQFSMPIRRGQTFSFTVDVLPKPEYELESYDPVTINVPPFVVPEEEIEAQLLKIADSYAEFVADDPHPVQVGDSLLLELEASHKGEKLEALSSTGRTYMTGMNLMPEEFETQIIGMDVGETKSFSFTLPGDEDGPIDCVATVKEIQKKVIPEFTDEWVQKHLPMHKDAAALKEVISKEVIAEAQGQYEAMKLQIAASELARRFKGHRIEDAIYEAMRDTILTNMRGTLQQQGLSFEQFVQSQGGEQQFGMMLMMQTREMLTQGYALDAIFRHEDLKLTDEDFDAVARQMDPHNYKAVRRDFEQNGRNFVLRETAERIKANKWLLDNAVVKIKGEKAPAAEESEAQ